MAKPGPGSLRCSVCAVSWPNHHNFHTCPGCHGSTDPIDRAPTLEWAEAESERKRYLFRDYLENETPEARQARQEKYQADRKAAEAARHAEQLQGLARALADQPPKEAVDEFDGRGSQ